MTVDTPRKGAWAETVNQTTDPSTFPSIPHGIHPTHLSEECMRQWKLKYPWWTSMDTTERRTTYANFKQEFMNLAVSTGTIAGWITYNQNHNITMKAQR